MKSVKSKAIPASAAALALAVLAASGAHAGKIDNLNNNFDKPGACVAADNPETLDIDESTLPAACVGAWNLDNVVVRRVNTETGLESDGLLDYLTGLYMAMTYGDSFVSIVRSTVDESGEVMARVSGKVWPVGEPTAIKVVNDDKATKNGKPENCIINTAYLGADDSSTGENAYLDSNNPEPLLCSSGFQSHKRFKIAMQPATTAGVANGAAGKPIDLVFNVSDDDADPETLNLRPYQVFSKINNYTGVRLKGYRIVVGQGLGDDFQSAAALGIADRLHLSLGFNEGGTTVTEMGEKIFTADGSDLFEGDGLATFSHGLFGAADKNFPSNGFFDDATAGFTVIQRCSVVGACPNYQGPTFEGTEGTVTVTLQSSDTIESTLVLPSNYQTLFGDWLPSKWQPSGVFFDDDNDPTTDPVLVAWWNGSAWVKNNDSGFAAATDEERAEWASNPLYSVDHIEDVLNLGINYIVKVGDGIGTDFTVRIIPVVAVDQSEPAFLAAEPAPLEPEDPAPVSRKDDGGCSIATGERPVDPVLPLLLALALAGLGLRRARHA